MIPIPEPWVIEYMRSRRERTAEDSRGRLELPLADPAEERHEESRRREVILEIGRAG